jgi:tetratricopeptide (TPR) repeat protein
MPLIVRGAATVLVLAASVSGAHAATPRDTLIQAAFGTHDKKQALSLINDALTQTQQMLAQNSANREAQLQQALGIGYRGQLTRSPADAKAAHRALETLVTVEPNNAEAQVAIAGWHLTAVGDLGNFLARTLLGASRDDGFAALDKAVAMGGNRAFFPAYAALIRIKLNTSDTATALHLAQRAASAQAPEQIDRILQRAAVRLIPDLQAGRGDDAARLAKQLLPFGTVS